MSKPSSITCIIHTHFKKIFKNDEDLKIFQETIRNYIETEVKIPRLKLVRQNQHIGFGVYKSNKISFRVGMSKEFFDMVISTNDRHEHLSDMNELLNKILSFINASEPVIIEPHVIFSRVSIINHNPLSIFFNKSIIAEFSTKNGRVFNPTGAILSSESDGKEISLMIEQKKDEVLLEISQTLEYDSIPMDILKEMNETINKSKLPILKSLGVTEK